MKVFHIDVRVVGFSQVAVQAETLEDAERAACDTVMGYKVLDLRWKETECTTLGIDDEKQT